MRLCPKNLGNSLDGRMNNWRWEAGAFAEDFVVGTHHSLINPDPENLDPYANLLKDS